MAGPSDKARFYLENSVSELNELERKKVFTKAEITAIAKKRSDFEHVVNARGSRPSDYVRYIEYEKNLDALRSKRIKRHGVKSSGSGSRTVFFLYNRGTRKFPGDLDLWMQYMEFARKEKAFKKLNEIFTTVVRLHPTKPGLWIYAAKYFMDTQADITNARSYMQRGLRFNKSSQNLWLEYAKLETIYIAKIAGRRRILGLDIDRTKKTMEEDADTDMISLPTVTAEDIKPSLGKDDGVDEQALQNLASAPVLTGAIPIAIFDSAMKQSKDDADLAEQFFDMFAEFDQLPCVKRILQHVLDHMQQTSPAAAATAICKFRSQFFGLETISPAFPSSLRASLKIMDSAVQEKPDMVSRLAEAAVRQLLPCLLNIEEHEEQVLRRVLVSSLKKYCRLLEEATSGVAGDAVAGLAEALRGEGKISNARRLVLLMINNYGENERLAKLQKALGT